MRIARTFVTMALLVGCLDSGVTGSAIPMWEFLSRDEKMSHLFRVFSQQVARFCADSSRPDCNKNLLVSGVRNLANMDDNLLDKLDPYQRGAKEMIWRAMVEPNGFSSRIGHDANGAYFRPESDPLATSETNGLGEEETASANDYVRPSAEHSGPYLIGPMVIRVYPDGRPVPEDSTRPLPRDEDADELRYARLPSIEEIEANGGSPFYEKRKKESRISAETRRSYIDRTRFRSDHPPFERRLLQEIATKRRMRYY